MLRPGGGSTGAWAAGEEAKPLKRGGETGSATAADCEQGGGPSAGSSGGSSGSPPMGESAGSRRGAVRWRGPGGGGADDGGARGAGSGGVISTGGGGAGWGLEVGQQLGAAAASSVFLVVIYKLLFSYPVEL